MSMLVFALIIVTFIQVFMTMSKSKKIKHIGQLTQVNELMGYIDRKELTISDESGKNAFMIASSSHFYTKKGELGFEDVIKNGITSGINMDMQNMADGKTALMYALKNENNSQIAEQLLKAGANVNLPDATGRLPLFESIKSNVAYNEVLKGTNDINHQDKYGVSALMIAAYVMNFKAIDDLLDRRINGQLKTTSGETAYDIAQKYMSRHIHHAVVTSQEDEFGKNSTITTSDDVLKAQQHNHKVREAVRKIGCHVNGQDYIEQAFKRPLINTNKAK